MRRCVLNFARGAWYLRGQERLRKSFLSRGYDGDFVFASNEKEFDSPTHAEMPYAFKSYAFQKAIKLGYEQIIWCDAAIYLYNENSLNRIYDRFESTGYLLQLNGWSTGVWCSDAALPLFGITREQAFKIPHIMANVMGFDVRNEKSREFLKQYHEHAQDGSFKGPWRNKNHEASRDNRVLGHRHDQTAGGVIAWRLGMDLLIDWTSYDPNNTRPMIVFLTHPA